jgi:hypothetical protein
MCTRSGHVVHYPVSSARESCGRRRILVQQMKTPRSAHPLMQPPNQQRHKQRHAPNTDRVRAESLKRAHIHALWMASGHIAVSCSHPSASSRRHPRRVWDQHVARANCPHGCCMSTCGPLADLRPLTLWRHPGPSLTSQGFQIRQQEPPQQGARVQKCAVEQTQQ